MVMILWSLANICANDDDDDGDGVGAGGGLHSNDIEMCMGEMSERPEWKKDTTFSSLIFF